MFHCFPSVPGVIGGLSFSGAGDDSVRVTWERPDYPNGIIYGYRVTVGYYESGRGQINTTETGNNTLSTTVRHISLGEWLSGGSMHAPLSPVALGECPLSPLLTPPSRAWCPLQWECGGHQPGGGGPGTAAAVLHQRTQ